MLSETKYKTSSPLLLNNFTFIFKSDFTHMKKVSLCQGKANCMRGFRNFCQRGSKFDNVFLVDGYGIQISL